MVNFSWKILECYSEAKGVKYYVSATDGKNTVESEGNYYFPEGTVNLAFEKIKESNLIDWIAKDDIQANLENQIKAIEDTQTVEFPWLAGTFTPQV